MKKLRAIVIGCGAIAQRRHLPELTARKDVELLAVVDPKLNRAKEQAQKFKATKYFADYKQALKLKPDVVCVCSPNAFHAEHSIAALKAKAHVICEKPMAATMSQARAMIAAAKANGRQLMVAHNQRMSAGHVRGKQIYQSGLLGKCLGFRTSFSHGGPQGWSVDGQQCHFFKKKLAVLGALADLGVHKLDLLRWLLEDDFVEVCGFYGRLDRDKAGKCEVDDIAFAALRTAKGAMGSLYAGWMNKSGCINETVLYCQRGVLRLEDDPQYSVIVEMQGGERQYIKAAASGTTAGNQNRSGVLDAFLDAVKTGKRVPITGKDAANSLAAVLACAKASDTRKCVRVENVK